MKKTCWHFTDDAVMVPSYENKIKERVRNVLDVNVSFFTMSCKNHKFYENIDCLVENHLPILIISDQNYSLFDSSKKFEDVKDLARKHDLPYMNPRTAGLYIGPIFDKKLKRFKEDKSNYKLYSGKSIL